MFVQQSQLKVSTHPKQFPNFIKKMDRTKCYKAEYLEVNLLFYKQRRIYQLIDFNDFISQIHVDHPITPK